MQSDSITSRPAVNANHKKIAEVRQKIWFTTDIAVLMLQN